MTHETLHLKIIEEETNNQIFIPDSTKQQWDEEPGTMVELEVMDFPLC